MFGDIRLWSGLCRPSDEVKRVLDGVTSLQISEWADRVMLNIPEAERGEIECWQRTNDPYMGSLRHWICKGLAVAALEKGHGDPGRIVDEIVHAASAKGVFF